MGYLGQTFWRTVLIVIILGVWLAVVCNINNQDTEWQKGAQTGPGQTITAETVNTTTSVVEKPTQASVKPGKSIQAIVSAYTSSVEETDDSPFKTSSGTTVHDGTLACPPKYRFGTKVLIFGKEYICEDRMGKEKRKGNYFDIWMSNKETARIWGVKHIKIIILN